MRAVDGIPLAPVYKKDFRSDRYKRKSSYIILGEVPSYIDQEFEVNLTVISNKRTCSKTLFHIIPAYFSLTPSLEFKLDTLSASAIKTRVDILTEKIMYGQDDATISDSLMRPVIALLEENDKTVVTANVSGYASIEGSTENNLQLQKTRAENILKHLGDFGISEASVNVKTSENFEEFRTDIKGTEFEELGNLSNAELKTLLLDRTKMLELEPILKNHRYAKLTIGVRWTEKIEFDLDTVQYLMKKAVANLSVGKIREAQSLQAKFAVNGELTVDDLYEVEIPRQKKFIRPLYNRLILQFYIDSTDNRYEALTLLRDSLASLITLDKSNKLLNTQHLIAEFETINFGGYKDRRKYMDKLKKRKFIDSKVHARLILKLASINDWSWWTSNGYSSPSNFMFKEVKKYVVPAGLSVEEKFQVARYYCFFHENKYAYSLTKSIVDDTDDPKNIIFFLKLIYLTDAHPDRKTYIRLFKKIQKIAGPEFCTFFNSPRLNFQIFKDPEVKEIYCEMCGDN